MNIEISGHHVDITDAMKSIAKKKFQKLEKRYADLGTISITVKVERNTQHIEVKTQFLGDTLSVSANSTDFYKAIDQVATKLDRSLSTRKDTSILLDEKNLNSSIWTVRKNPSLKITNSALRGARELSSTPS